MEVVTKLDELCPNAAGNGRVEMGASARVLRNRNISVTVSMLPYAL